jgi:RNA polymerase sigma-70 factor, ECF subfamily
MATAVLPLVLRRAGPSPIGKTIDDPALSCLEDADGYDLALVAAIAAGDVTALDRFYRRHRPAAFAVACKVLRDPTRAEDVVHDAFLRFWRSAASFEPGRGSPRAWLLTIVRNAGIDMLRAPDQVWQPRSTFTPYETNAACDEDICLTVAAATDARRLRAALTALPPEQRYAIELAFFGELTHGQIAQVTGVPLGTVKGRVRLGLRRLRRELRDLAPSAVGTQSIHLPAA